MVTEDSIFFQSNNCFISLLARLNKIFPFFLISDKSGCVSRDFQYSNMESVPVSGNETFPSNRYGLMPSNGRNNP